MNVTMWVAIIGTGLVCMFVVPFVTEDKRTPIERLNSEINRLGESIRNI